LTAPVATRARYRTRTILHPWLITYSAVAAMQLVRGDKGDLAFFFSCVAVLLLSEYLPDSNPMAFNLPQFAHGSLAWLLRAALIAFTATLIFEPRHSEVSATLMVWVLLPAMVLYAWSGPRFDVEERPKNFIQGERFWSSWAVVLTMIELLAILLGNIFKNYSQFPTISALLDPMLDVPIVKNGYVLIWLAVGFGLLQARKEPSS